jgi:hypothetical protein
VLTAYRGERSHCALLPALPLLNSPEAFVADMKEAAALVGAVRSILERRGL